MEGRVTYTGAGRLLIATRRCGVSGYAMREKPQPDPVPSDEPPPHPAEPLQISTPVIRLDGKIEPTIDDDDLRAFAAEDENALVAIEEFEKILRSQPPG